MNNYFCELSKNIWEDALRVEYVKNKNENYIKDFEKSDVLFFQSK